MHAPVVRIILAVLGTLTVCAAPSASDLARQVTHIELDPQACYRVSDLNFSKEDLRIYLTAGYLTFAKPIGGARIAAVFTTRSPQKETSNEDVAALWPVGQASGVLAVADVTADERDMIGAVEHRLETDGTKIAMPRRDLRLRDADDLLLGTTAPGDEVGA